MRKRVGLAANLEHVKRLKEAVCNNYRHPDLVCRLAQLLGRALLARLVAEHCVANSVTSLRLDACHLDVYVEPRQERELLVHLAKDLCRPTLVVIGHTSDGSSLLLKKLSRRLVADEEGLGRRGMEHGVLGCKDSRR